MNETVAAELLRQIVAIPSVNPALADDDAIRGEARLVEFLEPWFVSRGFRTERVGSTPGRPNLLARFGAGDDGLVVAVAHLSLGTASRRSQLAFIGELLADHRHAVLMGDFNCLADRPEMALLYQRTRLQPPGHAVPTFPAWRPQRAIDHILVTSDLGHGEMQAQTAAQSDHLALSLRLDVPLSALA